LGWDWWQAPATEPKRNRWHSQRGTSVTGLQRDRRFDIGSLGLGGLLEFDDVGARRLGSSLLCQARFVRSGGEVLAGARALIGSRAGIAAGGHFAARPELGGAGFSGLRCASGMCHLRAHRNRARAASPSGISEAVPWVPSCRRGWRCACGARWLQRGGGRCTSWTRHRRPAAIPWGARLRSCAAFACAPHSGMCPM
jgi:hypothetical protein